MSKHSKKSVPTAKAANWRQSKWLWPVGVGFVAVVVLGFHLLTSGSSVDPDLRAALIDQLSPEYPSGEFRSGVVADVERFGLPLDVYESEQVNVDLYRSIGERNYGVLVIRSHSGILELGGAEDQKVTALFTNESYARYKYVAEQLGERVLIVRPFDGDRDLTFGVTPSFFRKSMRGELAHTIVVVAGCSILGRADLAQALVECGASAVISWDRSVGLDHVDEATGLFIHHLLSQGMTVEKAAVAAMAEAGPDPEFGAVLRYYPASAGGYTAKELLAR